MAQYQTKPVLDKVDPVWARIRREAEEMARREPELATFIYSAVLHHDTLEAAVVYRLAERLDHPALSGELIRQAYSEALKDQPATGESFVVDPACRKSGTIDPDIRVTTTDSEDLHSRRPCPLGDRSGDSAGPGMKDWRCPLPHRHCLPHNPPRHHVAPTRLCQQELARLRSAHPGLETRPEKLPALRLQPARVQRLPRLLISKLPRRASLAES